MRGSNNRRVGLTKAPYCDSDRYPVWRRADLCATFSLAPYWPNGPDVCWFASLRLAVGGFAVKAPPVGALFGGWGPEDFFDRKIRIGPTVTQL